MWIIRFLSGPLSGQVVPLNKSSMLLGRAGNCDIKIPNPSVSKEHTRIEIYDDKVIVSDAGSRNGTFVNGVQVRSSKARSGDKVAMHDIIFEVQKVPDGWAQKFQQTYAPPVHGQALPSYGAAAPAYPPQHEADSENVVFKDLLNGRFPQMATLAQAYVERVILPGIYRLPEMFEFKWVLAGFMALFIILTTSLSMIPLAQILKSSIEEESQQHALTIATTLARVNRPFLMQGQEMAVSVDLALTRPGVKKAFIINDIDGNIIAPAAQAGSYPDVPYVHAGRKSKRESVKQIDGSTVVAMYPIEFYNSDTGSQGVTHWSVVVYDMGALAVDNGRVLSLFITTLFIALIVGAGLFYVLYKVIEYPIQNINSQLDSALKNGSDTVQVSYQFPALELLASNVSSALTRAVSGSENAANSNRPLEHDRNREVSNLVELIGFAAIGVRANDLSIAAANQAFESRVGGSSAQLLAMTVNDLADQALKLSIKDLIERVDKNPDDMATNELEFSGHTYNVVVQAVFGSSQIAYYLIVLLPTGEGE